MEASKCDPSRLDEGDLAFRLAPRINAAGRLYRADAGVELLLTEDESRAKQIAEELGRANSERRATEREVDAAAETARRELPDELKEANGLVVAGEGWHPGVVGIVASRMVERHHRPVVVISLDGEGGGRGSRSQHPRLRSARGARGLLRAPRDLRRPQSGRRAVDQGREPGGVPRRLRRPRQRGAERGGPEADRADRRDGRWGGARPRPRRRARAAGTVRDGQPRGAADGSFGPGDGCADDGRGGQTLALQPPQRLPSRPGRGLRPHQLRRRRRRHARRRRAPRGQPLERRGRAPRRPPRGLPARRGRRRRLRRTRARATKPNGGRASRPSSIAT